MAGLRLLVDTSVLGGADHHAGGPEEGAWAVSVVTVGELETGVLAASDSSRRAARLRRLRAVLDTAPALPVTRAVATRYAELRSASGRLPANDLWIAATAIAHDLLLVTEDERQARLPGVRTTSARR